MTKADRSTQSGPLTGITILEIGGIGPIPHFGMMCADLGATGIHVDKVTSEGPEELSSSPLMMRGRQRVLLNLKAEGAADVVIRLAGTADVVVEGFRPSVAERLGVGPASLLAKYPRLIYARMTGWGAFGPYATKAGHDINYVALSGALGAIGPAGGPPVVPLNLLGDYGGGSMMLLASVLAALVERGLSGKGQLVEVAMVDGVIELMAQHYADRANGKWTEARGENILGGGAPFYNTYETKDGRYVAVGAAEPRFFINLLRGLDLDEVLVQTQFEKESWPALKNAMSQVFATRTRDDWEAHFSNRDACVTPVLAMDEVPYHPHHQARETFELIEGEFQPRLPIRFSRTPSRMAKSPMASDDTVNVLLEAGFTELEITSLHQGHVITSSAE